MAFQLHSIYDFPLYTLRTQYPFRAAYRFPLRLSIGAASSKLIPRCTVPQTPFLPILSSVVECFSTRLYLLTKSGLRNELEASVSGAEQCLDVLDQSLFLKTAVQGQQAHL